MTAAPTELAQARARIAELEKALEPFAKARWKDSEVDILTMNIPKRYLVRARAALTGEKREGGE